MLEWFKGIGVNITENAEKVAENIGSVLIMLGIVVLVVSAAQVSENIICKKNGIDRNSERFKINRMTLISIMSVLSVILDIFGFYLVPNMYKVNAGELPCIIGAFAMGPVAGILIEAVKIILNIIINGTQTAFIGEFANFVMGCCFVLPASIVYFRYKTRKKALTGLALGTVICVVAGVLLNRFLLLPMYAGIYYGGDVGRLVGEIGKSADVVSGMGTLLVWIVVPCNLIKCVGVSIITMLIYKPVSHLIKQNDYNAKKNTVKS